MNKESVNNFSNDEEAVGSIEAITNRMRDLALDSYDGSKKHGVLLREIANLEVRNLLIKEKNSNK